jgi:hypothetical protein
VRAEDAEDVVTVAKYLEKSRHDVGQVVEDDLLVLRVVGHLGQHLDGRLVDRVVPRLDDGVEDPDDQVRGQHPGHGARAALRGALRLVDENRQVRTRIISRKSQPLHSHPSRRPCVPPAP